MALSNTSRYLLTEVVELRSSVTGELVRKPFVDLRQRYQRFSQDDKSLIYTSNDSWAGIGARHLSDANAWWVIADMSGVIDPFVELTEGRSLRTPSIARYQLSILPSDMGSF
jgi:hypothetical protein